MALGAAGRARGGPGGDARSRLRTWAAGPGVAEPAGAGGARQLVSLAFVLKGNAGVVEGALATGRPADLISRRGTPERVSEGPRRAQAYGWFTGARRAREDLGHLEHLGGCVSPKTRRSQPPRHLLGHVQDPSVRARPPQAPQDLRIEAPRSCETNTGNLSEMGLWVRKAAFI